jgi:hypothetical protein
MEFFIVSSFISTFSVVLPLLIYSRTKGMLDYSMIYLALLLLVSFFADVIGMANSLYFKLAYINETASYIYYFLAIVLVCLFYKAHFPASAKSILTWSMILFCFVYGYWLVKNPSIVTRHESKVPVGILFSILTLAHFFVLIKKMPSVYIQRVTMFWIDSGLLIYSSGMVILFIISNYLVFILKKDQLEYWIFHNLLNTISNILIAVGFFRVKVRSIR